ncbi:MAG: chromosome partitioning protein [Spirochaetales bacterium]|nr:chromosome partitioning protein [Spirochaetales bacterium]MBP7263173.1 chromosome partitioning protein [Spirochaetia bacterium]
MSDDTDLRGLSVSDARAYVLEFLTTLKTTERDLAALDEELALWNKRVELAASKGASDLEAGARAKVAELAARRTALSGEKDSLIAKIARMKEQLPILRAQERSVDVDLLLAELQVATGEALGDTSASVNQGLASLGADDELAALKRKLGGGNPEA